VPFGLAPRSDGKAFSKSVSELLLKDIGGEMKSVRAAITAFVVVIASLSAQAQEGAVVTPLSERPNQGLIELITGPVAGSSARAGEDLATVLDDGATRRVLPVVGKGSLQNLIDLRMLRGIDLAVVQIDVLNYAKAQMNPAGITYVAKLYNEEVHLLGRSDVASISDLAGKKVNLGLQGDGASITGPRLFDLLKTRVEITHYDQDLALEKLKSGEIAAMLLIGGKPIPQLQRLSPWDGLRFIPIPSQVPSGSDYFPALLTADDYPGLVTAAQPVDTVSVGTVMLVANLTPGSERYRNVANFTEAFFTQFPKLLEPSRHPKWKEVNLAADLPGWRRFPAADAWLKRNALAAAAPMDDRHLQEVFSKFIKDRSQANGGAMSDEQTKQLFTLFQQWQASQPR
jgi:TRAP transporter TAXI family solute receptor